jgi:hypothetical protein
MWCCSSKICCWLLVSSCYWISVNKCFFQTRQLYWTLNVSFLELWDHSCSFFQQTLNVYRTFFLEITTLNISSDLGVYWNQRYLYLLSWRLFSSEIRSLKVSCDVRLINNGGICMFLPFRIFSWGWGFQMFLLTWGLTLGFFLSTDDGRISSRVSFQNLCWLNNWSVIHWWRKLSCLQNR